MIKLGQLFVYTYCSVPASVRIDGLLEGPTLGGHNTDEKELMSLAVTSTDVSLGNAYDYIDKKKIIRHFHTSVYPRISVWYHLLRYLDVLMTF